MGRVINDSTRPLSRQMEAILILASHPLLQPILSPVIDLKSESVDFGRIDYGVLSGGAKTAIAWAWCIWKDEQIPEHSDGDKDFHFTIREGVRDPFSRFGVMERRLQLLITKALLHRWS
jgi:hypothetical protein